ncbi:hypothetical protein [Nocardioides sp.]|uniref:hypothetical protein n=1 Tax=Nocardioides sp. TaxID=35761 RepID=UPI0019C6DE3A|nr:hypothetical protein [Nocardioides sp.]MBC7276099.1 hypothetical protein [Nocardioides sp.]
MTVEVTVRDETTAGDVLQELALQLEAEQVTVRELIISRVASEVRAYNAGQVLGGFRGLVQPPEAELALNGPREPRMVDAEIQAKVAVEAFERGRFLLLVDDRQVTEFDERVVLRTGSAVSFLKLTPLVGG